MPKADSVEAACPKCGGAIPVICYESLDAELFPEAKKRLTDGTLFSAVCPECGELFNFTYPLLYHDAERRVMIQFTTERDEAEDFIASAKDSLAMMNAAIPEGEKKYDYRVVFHPNELREKVKLFDLGLDDRAAEITKFICALNLNKSDPLFEIAACYLVVDANGEYHVQFLSSNGKSHVTDIDKAMYDDVANSFAAIIKDKSTDCYIIDCRWAANAIK